MWVITSNHSRRDPRAKRASEVQVNRLVGQVMVISEVLQQGARRASAHRLRPATNLTPPKRGSPGRPQRRSLGPSWEGPPWFAGGSLFQALPKPPLSRWNARSTPAPSFHPFVGSRVPGVGSLREAPASRCAREGIHPSRGRPLARRVAFPESQEGVPVQSSHRCVQQQGPLGDGEGETALNCAWMGIDESISISTSTCRAWIIELGCGFGHSLICRIALTDTGGRTTRCTAVATP